MAAHPRHSATEPPAHSAWRPLRRRDRPARPCGIRLARDDGHEHEPEASYRPPHGPRDPPLRRPRPGRLPVDATHAELEGVANLATLKSRVDAGSTVMAKVKIDPASLVGAGPLVATKVEVDGGENGDDVRCCLPGSGAHDDCEQQSAGDCSDASGLNMGPGSCEPNPCP